MPTAIRVATSVSSTVCGTEDGSRCGRAWLSTGRWRSRITSSAHSDAARCDWRLAVGEPLDHMSAGPAGAVALPHAQGRTRRADDAVARGLPERIRPVERRHCGGRSAPRPNALAVPELEPVTRLRS